MVTRRHPLSRRFPSSLVSPVVAGTFPFARKIARTSSLKTKKTYLQVSPPVCSILQDSVTDALQSQGRRGIGPGIEERCWQSWCFIVESAGVGVRFTG